MNGFKSGFKSFVDKSKEEINSFREKNNNSNSNSKPHTTGGYHQDGASTTNSPSAASPPPSNAPVSLEKRSSPPQPLTHGNQSGSQNNLYGNNTQQQQQQQQQPPPPPRPSKPTVPSTTTPTSTHNQPSNLYPDLNDKPVSLDKKREGEHPPVSLTKSNSFGVQQQPVQPVQPVQPITRAPSKTNVILPPSSHPSHPSQQQQQDKNMRTSLNQIPTTLTKQSEKAETNAKIALATIGAPIGGAIVLAQYPQLQLSDRMYIANIQFTEIILEIEEATIKQVILGEKKEPIYKKQKLIIYKTIVDEVVIIQIGDIYIYTNMKEKPSVRIYGYHYMLMDNYGNYFIIKVDKDTKEEDINKLEVILMYYTTFYRVPIKQKYHDETAKKIQSASSGVEKGSLYVSKGLVTGGTYFAKGAAKVGNIYKNNTKKYDGAEMTDEQRAELEDPNSEANKSARNADKIAQGTSSVKKGIVGAFGFAGEKISQGVRQTDWYKEREEEKKKKEAEHGKNEKKSAGAGAASTGISAIKNVWGGLEEGVLISARGVRDASVDAKRHTSGDYEAELSKKKWNAAGSLTVSMVNVMSIMSATWIKGALYAAAGAISYDPDKIQHLKGAYYKAGWMAHRADLMSGVGWTPRWVVLRNSTIAIYLSPTDPTDKPITFTYITKVKGVKRLTEERISRSHGMEIVTTSKSLYLSTFTPEVDWSHELMPIPDPEIELMQWIDGILNVQTFVGVHLEE